MSVFHNCILLHHLSCMFKYFCNILSILVISGSQCIALLLKISKFTSYFSTEENKTWKTGPTSVYDKSRTVKSTKWKIKEKSLLILKIKVDDKQDINFMQPNHSGTDWQTDGQIDMLLETKIVLQGYSWHILRSRRPVMDTLLHKL